MITPFGPPNDELDRLNSALDAQVTGKRAPEIDPASDTAPLANAARFVSGHTSMSGEEPSTDTLDSIWRNVMDAHAIPAQPVSGDMLPGQQDDIGRVQPVRGPEPATFSSWISLAAVAALLIGIVGAAWGLRQGGGDDEPIRLAATALDETPVADEEEWLTWVTPEECTAEPMTTEEYAEIMREEPDISGRSYEVVGPADAETAEAVANAARAHEACGLFGTYQQERALQTDGYIFFRQFSANQTLSYGEWLAMNRKHGMLLSETMPVPEPSDRLVMTVEQPPDELPPLLPPPDIPVGDLNAMVFSTPTYLPEKAMLLADGRIAIPVTTLAWSGNAADPEYERAVRGFFDRFLENDRLLILSDKSGTWKVDEDLRFCQSDDCDQFWNPTLATPDATPVATPED